MKLFAKHRIKNELNDLSFNIHVEQNESELSFSLKFNSYLYNRNYDFIVKYPDDYPFKTPKVYIKQHVFHPNIYNNSVCLEICRLGWKPCYDINTIISCLILIFEEPRYENAFNIEAGQLLQYKYEQFIKTVKEVDLLNDKND
ncbi:UBC2 [Hepatospora eriocheir]|uniref:UBC2 n=1 Tax=Hepatospora eriocheir TaxID=1081669 RepID=A0A1X0Q9B4_9MICR|nr:UBC2 [Hepatospora eriocheir]